MSTGPFIAPAEVPWTLFRSGTFHTDFQKKIQARRIFDGMGVALVDLTTGAPRYATTNQEHVDKHVFSVAKTAPFFAAFRLRERLRNQFSGDPATTTSELVAKIEKTWKPLIAAQVSDRISAPDFPRLERIFDLSKPPWTFRFKGEPGTSARHEKLVWKLLESVDEQFKGQIPKSEIDTLVFFHRLRLGVRMSDDNAAGSIASDVGMAYMYGALTSDGLYDKRGKHGLWLGNSYGYDNKFLGFEGSGVQLTAGATAFAIAELLARLHFRKLVDPDSCDEMLDILRERSSQGIGTGSRFDVTSRRQTTHSKIGLWVPTGNTSEGAIIRSMGEKPDKSLSPVIYIAVGLQDVGGNRMNPLIDVMDAHVKEANNLK